LASSRTIVIAGAGIGGMTAALTLAKAGFRIHLREQAERLEEAGAGIQLTPNATRILFDLGLREALEPHAVAPEEIRIRSAASGRMLARIPLGAYAHERYGAPYWIVHRQDLQAVLLNAVGIHPDIDLALGCKVHDFASHANGVTVYCGGRQHGVEDRGIALIGADGLWSAVRERLGQHAPPRFRNRIAWRATISAADAPAACGDSAIGLWLGADTHLVHYPIRGGRDINIVAITREHGTPGWTHGWTHAGTRDELLARFTRRKWAAPARDILSVPAQWQRFALYDSAIGSPWGQGGVTLLGDAAHAMLPFLAQGAAMAIEDACVLAACLKAPPTSAEQALDHVAAEGDQEDITRGLRRYEMLRDARTRRAQRAAARNGAHYHRRGIEAVLRNLALRLMGGEQLLQSYDWIYRWPEKA
jgi:salicylate hydroxylase